MKTMVRALLVCALFLLIVPPLAAQDDVEANKALALRFVEEVFNVNNTDLIDQVFAEDFVLYGYKFAQQGPTGDLSRDSLTGLIRDVHGNGVYETYEDPILVAEGDMVAILYLLKHDQPNYEAVTPGIDILRFDQGRIAEGWGLIDIWSYRQSLASSEADVVGDGWYPQVGESTTTVDENRALAASAIDLWQTGEVERLAEVYADDLVFHLPPGIRTEPLDGEGLAQYITWLRAAMPDLTLTTEDMPLAAEGDLVVCAYAFTGTFAPEGAAFPRKINAQALDVYRVVDGKIAEVWWLWQPPDPDGMPARLFAMPE